MQAERPLWVPDREIVERSPMAEFIDWCGERFGRSFADYDAFHDWSVSERGAFWTAVWEHCKVIGESGEKALVDGDRMLDARFFPEARLNFAENLLRKTGSGDALIFRGEDKVSYRLTWDELRALVSRLQQALRAQGIGAGDRVAAMMPNMPETIALMLATASVGAIWSSCSPDFGEQGVLDRFGQIAPSSSSFATATGTTASGRTWTRRCVRWPSRSARPPSSFPMPETAPRLRRPSRAG